MSAEQICSRCGHRSDAASRFCSNCGAPLRAGLTPERASETTSTISISGLEAYEAEVSGQPHVSSSSLSPEAQAAVEALPPVPLCSSCGAVPTPGAASCWTVS